MVAWGFGHSAVIRHEVVDGRDSIVIGDRTRVRHMRLWTMLLVMMFFMFGCVGLLPPSPQGVTPLHLGWRLGIGFGAPVVFLGIIVLLLRNARRELRKVIVCSYDDDGVLIATHRGERVVLRDDLMLQRGEIEGSLVFGAKGRRASVFLCELGVPLFPVVCTRVSHRDRAESMFLDVLGIGAGLEPIGYWLEEKTTFLRMPDPALISIMLGADADTSGHAPPAGP